MIEEFTGSKTEEKEVNGGKSMLKDELRGRNEKEADVRKMNDIEENTINNGMKIAELSRCLKDKDKRLKKIESRWKSAMWSAIAGFLILIVWGWMATVDHVHSHLPWPVITEYSNTISYTVTDWWLMIGMVLMDILSVIGLLAVIWFSYSDISEWKKSKGE